RSFGIVTPRPVEPQCVMVLGSVARRCIGEVGFTLIELAVVVAIIGIAIAVSTPTLLSYWDTAALHAAARELAGVINLGRQLAISTRTSVCLDLADTTLR